MKRGTRTALLTIGIVLSLLLLAAILAPLWLPGEAIRALVVREIERQVRQPVRVESVRLAILPSPRVQLTGLEISAVPGKPLAHLSLDRLVLQTRLLPLLRRRVEIVRVVIDRPLVEILMPGPDALRDAQRGADATEGADGGPGRPAAPPLDIAVRELLVKDGSIRVLQPDGTPLLELMDVGERLSIRATTAGRLELRGETRVASWRLHLAGGSLGQGIPLTLRKELIYTISDDRLQIDESVLDLGGLPAAVEGTVTGVRTKAPIADLLVAGGPASVGNIQGLLPAALIPAMEGVRSEGTLALKASLRGPLGDPEPGVRSALAFSLDLALSDGRIEHPLLHDPLRDIAVRLHADPDTLEVSELRARSGDSRIDARMTVVSYMTDPHLTVALDADVDLAPIPALQGMADSLRLSGRAVAQLVITGPARRPQALTIVGRIRANAVEASGPWLPVPLSAGRADLVLERDALTIHEMSGTLGSSDVGLRGRIAGYTALLDPHSDAAAGLNVDLRSRALNLDEWIPLLQEVDMRRFVPGLPQMPPAALAARLEGTIRVDIAELLLHRARAQDVRGTIALHRGIFDLTGIGLRAFGGSLASTGTLDFTTPAHPRFELHTRVEDVQATALFAYASAWNRFARLGEFLRGELDLTAEMSGTLDEQLMLDPQSLASTGDLQMQDGQLADHPLQIALADYLDSPALASLSISDWAQPFHIENGRLSFDGLALAAGGIEVTGRGWQALDGRVEMGLHIALPREFSDALRGRLPAELAQVLLAGDDARILLPFTVSGEMPKPKIAIDVEALRAGAQERVQERLREESERLQQAARARLQEEARTRAGGLLDRILGGTRDTTGRADTLAADSLAPAETTRTRSSEIEEDVQGLLKGLLKGGGKR